MSQNNRSVPFKNDLCSPYPFRNRMARSSTLALATLLLALAFVQFAFEGADAARVGRHLAQKTDPKEPNEPKDAKGADENGFFARLKMDEGADEAATDDSDRRKARKLAATIDDVSRHLLQKTDPKEPNEPKDAKDADENGFFARLKMDEGADEAATDDSDRRKARKLA